MDFGVADTINRHVARIIAARLDQVDADMDRGIRNPANLRPWHSSPLADVLMAETPGGRSDRAWLIGQLAARTPDVAFDGTPADADWDNLFSHFRAEILARRDPDSSPARVAEIPARGMV